MLVGVGRHMQHVCRGAIAYAYAQSFCISAFSCACFSLCCQREACFSLCWRRRRPPASAGVHCGQGNGTASPPFFPLPPSLPPSNPLTCMHEWPKRHKTTIKTPACNRFWVSAKAWIQAPDRRHRHSYRHWHRHRCTHICRRGALMPNMCGLLRVWGFAYPDVHNRTLALPQDLRKRVYIWHTS